MNTKPSNLTFPTKLTVAGLIACAVAIWIQWLSGDPAYPKFPPGPVFFMAVAAIVAFGARWWWTPLIGSLIAGRTVDYFTHTAGGVVTRNWQSFWISSSLSAFIILLLIAIFFRSHSKIVTTDSAAVESTA